VWWCTHITKRRLRQEDWVPDQYWLCNKTISKKRCVFGGWGGWNGGVAFFQVMEKRRNEKGSKEYKKIKPGRGRTRSSWTDTYQPPFSKDSKGTYHHLGCPRSTGAHTTLVLSTGLALGTQDGTTEAGQIRENEAWETAGRNSEIKHCVNECPD
jgi:hypothetical protein